MSSEAANTGLPGSVIATGERHRAPFWGARIDAQLVSTGNWQMTLFPRELTDMASNMSPLAQGQVSDDPRFTALWCSVSVSTPASTPVLACRPTACATTAICISAAIRRAQSTSGCT